MKLYALDGQVFDPVLVTADRDVHGCLRLDGRCCGCGSYVGEAHEAGCDWERCPRCGGQFICCDCEHSQMPIYTESEARDLIVRLMNALDRHATKGGQ